MDLSLCRYNDDEHDGLETTIEWNLRQRRHQEQQRCIREVEMHYMIGEPINDGILEKLADLR